MNTREFLALLLPSTGFLFSARPLANKGWANDCHTSIDSLIAAATGYCYAGWNSYFAMASYTNEKVWNVEKEKWQTRTQENAQSLKCFYLDLDIDPEDPDKFPDRETARQELEAFIAKVGLPTPLIVDSGGGWHIYWPLAHEVTTAQWRPVADAFKSICLHEKFRADRSLTSDQARVLRVPGTYNFRRGRYVSVVQDGGVYGFADFSQRIQAYVDKEGINVNASPVRSSSPIPGNAAAEMFGDNLGVTNDPLNFDRITFSCPQLQNVVADRGAKVGEQLWRATLGVVKFCEPMHKAMEAVSDGHPNYDPSLAISKIDNWNTGPTACEHFHQLNPSTCEGCPHYQKIKSPAVLGRQVKTAPAPQVTITVDTGLTTTTFTLPDPPTGYSRRASDGAIVLESEDENGTPHYEVISPYDLYPLAVRAQTGEDADISEHSQWRVHLPLKRGQGRTHRDIDIPLGTLSDLRGLSKLLFSKGLVLTGDQPKMTQHFMSAYLQKLTNDAGREQLYERLGWHDDNSVLVVGDRAYHRDGSVTANTLSNAVKMATKVTQGYGLRVSGTMAAWQAAMQFYNRPGYEGHRFFVYCALGAPIFHMNGTGNKGVLVTASGESGRGKSTCLMACSSLWGHPEALMVNGNKDGSTINALYSSLGTIHSLPFLWDDITERDPDDLLRFLLNISQGQGKRRMASDTMQAAKMDTWATMVLASANTNDISRIMAKGRDVNPHLMRLIEVEFSKVDQGAEAKIAADNFIRAINANYGHVGPVFAKTLAVHYQAIQAGFVKNVAMVDRMLASSNASAERFWSAAVAAAYTGAILARSLGLINYPVEADLQWMVDHLTRQRVAISETANSPLELLVQFLNENLRGTLIVGSKAASNLDNVVQKPSDSLVIRNDLDNKLIYVARSAIIQYCADKGIPFKPFETTLERDAVIRHRNQQKVLGAETVYAAGQTRCWCIEASKLGGMADAAPATPAPAAATGTHGNVYQFGKP